MNLTMMEVKIVDARQRGVGFCDMDEKEQNVSMTGVIFTIAVISGCPLPTNQAHVNALDNELIRFIKDYGYSNFTSEEILTAFRMNANLELEEKVENYGAVFNIDYVGKVLSQYKYFRQVLDRKLADKYIKIQEEKYYAEKEKGRREKIKTQYKKYLNDEVSDLDLSDCYTQLCKDGAFFDINIDKKFMEAAIKKVVIPENLHPNSEFVEIGRKMYLGFAAEQLAVEWLFKSMRRKGMLEVYDANFKFINPGFILPEKKQTEIEDMPY